MARVVFAWLFGILAYLFAKGQLLSQLPVAETDIQQSPFYFLLSNYPVRLGFDVLLTCSCIICAVIPEQKPVTWLCVIGIWVLFLVYLGNAVTVSLIRPASLLVIFPFLSWQHKTFSRFWKWYRYLICILYVCAGISLLIFETNGLAGQLVSPARWFVFGHSDAVGLLHSVNGDYPGLYQTGIGVSLLAVVGLFTTRFDRWFVLILLVFYLLNLFSTGAGFVEQSLIFAPFLPWQAWAGRLQITSSDDRPIEF